MTVTTVCTLVAGSVLAATAAGSPGGEAATDASPYDIGKTSYSQDTSSQETFSQETSQESASQKYSTEELRAWGIAGNCIDSHRIRNIRFRDDESAIIQVTGGKRVLMTLERRCPGIRSRGFLHQTRINRLCTSDSLRVIDTGSICMIRDFTPYFEDRDLEDRADEDEVPIESSLDTE